MFFEKRRAQFFNPLTGKYREVVVECLRLLYLRLYSELRDYNRVLDRETLVAIFMEAIARQPAIFDDEQDSEGEGRFKNQRELAGFILNKLLEHHWLERLVDSASLSSHYAFTQAGRLFTEPFIAKTKTRLHTRHRNTRNTRNSLQAFLDRGDYSDLLDAYDYSERIISDFTDIIAELGEQRRELVKEMENQQLLNRASDQFFDYMEQRFVPDLAVRLSADSVEKHRDAINRLINNIKHKSKDFKKTAEGQLRQVLPQLVLENNNRSVLYYLLDVIARRLRDACDTMLPELRSALNSFTRRAQLIMRQLSYAGAGQSDQLISLCQHLYNKPQRQNHTFTRAALALGNCQLRFVDPGQNQMRQRRRPQRVSNQVVPPPALDKTARRELYIQQVLDQAFALQGSQLRDYIFTALRDNGVINSRYLPVNNATDLLKLCHVIEVAASENLSSEYHFEVTERPRLTDQYDDYLIERDLFDIRLLDTPDDSPPPVNTPEPS